MSVIDNEKAAVSIALRPSLREFFTEMLGDEDDEESEGSGMVNQIVSGQLSSVVAKAAAGLKV